MGGWRAARALSADQHGQRRDPSRCVGIPGWAGGAAHAPLRGPARDGAAIADRRISCIRGGGSQARGSRAFTFGLNRRHTARRAPGHGGSFQYWQHPFPTRRTAGTSPRLRGIAPSRYAKERPAIGSGGKFCLKNSCRLHGINNFARRSSHRNHWHPRQITRPVYDPRCYWLPPHKPLPSRKALAF